MDNSFIEVQLAPGYGWQLYQMFLCNVQYHYFIVVFHYHKILISVRFFSLAFLKRVLVMFNLISSVTAFLRCKIQSSLFSFGFSCCVIVQPKGNCLIISQTKWHYQRRKQGNNKFSIYVVERNRSFINTSLRQYTYKTQDWQNMFKTFGFWHQPFEVLVTTFWVLVAIFGEPPF